MTELKKHGFYVRNVPDLDNDKLAAHVGCNTESFKGSCEFFEVSDSGILYATYPFELEKESPDYTEHFLKHSTQTKSTKPEMFYIDPDTLQNIANYRGKIVDWIGPHNNGVVIYDKTVGDYQLVDPNEVKLERTTLYTYKDNGEFKVSTEYVESCIKSVEVWE